MVSPVCVRVRVCVCVCVCLMERKGVLCCKCVREGLKIKKGWVVCIHVHTCVTVVWECKKRTEND